MNPNHASSQAIRAVVLDWAGTAVDYGCVGPVAVFLEVFKRRGVDVTLAEARAPMGLMKKDHLKAMCAMGGVADRWLKAFGAPPSEADIDAMYKDTEALMVGCVKDHADLIPGLIESMGYLRERGIKIGSTTGYTRPMMNELVPVAAGRGYRPDAVYCSDEAPAGRPYPWMCYLNAMALSVFPMSAMVKIGDTVADILEGLNAGMWTIGTTRTGNELGLTEKQADALPEAEIQPKLEAIGRTLTGAGAHELIEGIWDLPLAILRIEARIAAGERP